jgi:hypothetical protein
MSVFILSGPELKAMATLEGPVAPLDVDSGSALLDATERFRRGERFGEHTVMESKVDFEHLQASFESEDDEGEEEIPENEGAAERRERVQRARAKARERRQREQARQEATQQKIRSAGEPFQTTIQAKSAGWYRACVRGTWYQVSANFEYLRCLSFMTNGLKHHSNVFAL